MPEQQLFGRGGFPPPCLDALSGHMMPTTLRCGCLPRLTPVSLWVDLPETCEPAQLRFFDSSTHTFFNFYFSSFGFYPPLPSVVQLLMRLLQLEDGKFSLVEYVGSQTPPYAILSHTWGADHDEVTFKDLIEGTDKTKTGYRKLTFCATRAAQDGLQFFWVDTCCIDKSSSTELAEAINSMYRWYHESSKCYVYLSDVSVNDWKPAFGRSRWFTRGWTLQELLAPSSVEFFSVEGDPLGSKASMALEISQITGISMKALLEGRPLTQSSVKERMFWAQGRETKREEDAAYSLLGIFDIHMPLIYGEGRVRALERLEHQIHKSFKKKMRALSQAAKEDREDAVRELLDEGLDPNSKDAEGCTVLFSAVRNGNEELVRFLIEKGADPDVEGLDGLTPLWEATYRQYGMIGRILLAKSMEFDPKEGEAVLTWASYNGEVEEVEFLLKGGMDLNTTDRWGATPLFWAAINGQTAMVEWLLKRGADPDPRNRDGRTPLWIAAHHGYEGVVRLLLEHGADLRVRDRWNEDMQSWAAARGHQGVVRLLTGNWSSRGLFSRVVNFIRFGKG